MSQRSKRLARIMMLESLALEEENKKKKKKEQGSMFVGIQGVKDTETFNKHFTEPEAVPEAATPDGSNIADSGAIGGDSAASAGESGGLGEDLIAESSLTLKDAMLADGSFLECRWDKNGCYEVCKAWPGKDDVWQEEFIKNYPSKEAALKAFGRYVKLFGGEKAKEETESLTEAKRYVRRYYIKPQNIFCSNKAEILKALIDIDTEDCTVYTLNNLGDVKDVTKLTDKDIIYYYKDEILYDKNHIKVMDYDLYIKHEEERDNINPNQVSDAKFGDVYDDRMTDVTVVENLVSLKDGKAKCEVVVKGNNFKTVDGGDIVLSGKVDKQGLWKNFVDSLECEKSDIKVTWTGDFGDETYYSVVYAESTDRKESLTEDMEGYNYITTNGYKIYNAENYAVDYKYIIAYYDSREDCLWFQGAYNDYGQAREVAEDSRGCEVITAKNTKFYNAGEIEESIQDEFDLDFIDVDAFGRKLHEGKEIDGTCCICGEDIEGYGNNAEPYKEGRCCDACNLKFVIPARLENTESKE